MNENCVVCHRKIEVAIFKGSDYCSDQCKKAAGADVSSVGTHMFVTTEEYQKILKGRLASNGKRS